MRSRLDNVSSEQDAPERRKQPRTLAGASLDLVPLNRNGAVRSSSEMMETMIDNASSSLRRANRFHPFAESSFCCQNLCEPGMGTESIALERHRTQARRAEICRDLDNEVQSYSDTKSVVQPLKVAIRVGSTPALDWLMETAGRMSEPIEFYEGTSW